MKKIFWLVFLCFIFIRVYYNNHGLILYDVSDLPSGVNGTVYTYMPDEKEFLGCYRGLGYDIKKISGEMPFNFNFQTIKILSKKILTGEVSFAPVYPTASSPLMSYLVFFVTFPIIAVKYLCGFYQTINTNIIFYDAILIGRYITAFLNLILVFIIYKILSLFEIKNHIKYLIIVIVGLMPANIIISHLLSYNPLVVLFELSTLYYLLKYIKKNSINDFFIAAYLCGLGIATKITAVAILPFFIAAYFFSNSGKDKIKNSLTDLFGGYIRVAASFCAIIIYGVISRFDDFQMSILVYFENIKSSPTVTTTAPKNIVVYDFLTKTLPTAFSPTVYIIFIFSILILIFSGKIFKNKLFLLIFAYFTLIFYGTSVSTLNYLMRLLLPLHLGLILLGIFLNEFILNRKVIYILFFLIVLNLSTDLFILLKYYKNTDIRIISSEWIKENIKEQSTIGVIDNFPYWWAPEYIFTDYFWNTEKKYKYTIQFDLKNIKTIDKPDYIITTRFSALDYKYKQKFDGDAIQTIEKNGYKLIKEFKPQLNLGKYQLNYELNKLPHLNIFVSDIYIYKYLK